jgi:pyruvate dehydrogenase E1 component alpha subunit
MGTSINRSSMNPHFYTKGDQIPGIQADGNDVFEVREVIKFAKSYAIEKGPLCIEFVTYRYSGHSMSDPGTSYRTRDEVKEHRQQHDPISLLGHIGVENKLVTQ